MAQRMSCCWAAITSPWAPVVCDEPAETRNIPVVPITHDVPRIADPLANLTRAWRADSRGPQPRRPLDAVRDLENNHIYDEISPSCSTDGPDENTLLPIASSTPQVQGGGGKERSKVRFILLGYVES